MADDPTTHAPARSSDDARFDAIVLPQLDAVARFARALTREDDDADDLVQETVLRAYRAWHTFHEGSDARPWLFAICRNAFVQLRRAQGRLVHGEEGDVDALPSVRLHVELTREGMGDLLEMDELRAAVRRAVDALPEPHHSVLVLADLEDFSYEETARILGIPVGTVRSRLFRARRAVQESLRDHARDLGLVAARSAHSG